MGRSLSPDDLTRYRMLSPPSFSPDGSKVAISVHQADAEGDSYQSDVWVVDIKSSNVLKFTSGGKDFDPVWSPDGRSILFLSKRGIGRDEKGSELYIISASGGESRRVHRRKEGIDSPVWSPDSRRVAFLSAVTEGEQNDIKVIRRIGFWFNGIGWTYNMRKHVFICDVESGQAVQLTQGEFDVKGMEFSHDGKKVAYAASIDDQRPSIVDLFILDLATNETKKLTSSDMEISSVAWSPDDQLIAFLGNKFPRGFASHNHIWLVSSNGSSVPRDIDNVDRNKNNSLNSDVRAHAHAPSNILWKGDYIYYYQAEKGAGHVYRMKPGGPKELVLGGDMSVEGFDVQGERVVFVSMDSSHPEELYLKEKTVTRLTNFNEKVLEEYDVLSPKGFTFVASDGVKVDGWVLMPKDTKGKCPAILYVHGGPKTAFGHAYLHEFQVFASKGYAVIFMNPRGSDGYSEEFADIRGSYGKRDYDDLMEGLDFVLSHFPSIDKERLGIAGGSYGGFMTNWVIGHTRRFKAAVADRSIASWVSFFATSDIGREFTVDQIGSDPWKDEEKLLLQSPLRYVDKVTTPLLVIHSVEDYRCWWVEGIQMFSALKYLGKETEMVLFHGENHDLSRAGKPKHRIARLKHYLRWFDKYLSQIESTVN
jgi:dipeptidyl aminopeptidase/acylaminoacyl peptidase